MSRPTTNERAERMADVNRLLVFADKRMTITEIHSYIDACENTVYRYVNALRIKGLVQRDRAHRTHPYEYWWEPKK